jgi:hypothetical protein
LSQTLLRFHEPKLAERLQSRAFTGSAVINSRVSGSRRSDRRNGIESSEVKSVDDSDLWGTSCESLRGSSSDKAFGASRPAIGLTLHGAHALLQRNAETSAATAPSFQKTQRSWWDLAHEFKLPASRSFPAHGLMVALAQQQKAAAMTGISKKNQQNCRGKSQRIGNSAQRLA